MSALSASGLCAQVEPAAGTWKTWVVPAVNEIDGLCLEPQGDGIRTLRGSCRISW